VFGQVTSFTFLSVVDFFDKSPPGTLTSLDKESVDGKKEEERREKKRKKTWKTFFFLGWESLGVLLLDSSHRFSLDRWGWL
jgi:hypothetical protein